MQDIKNITEDIFSIGTQDRKLSLFEAVYPLKDGVSYNSYLINDDKTVLIDTVDKHHEGQFFENLTAALNFKPLDYLIVQHMEPDHCALIKKVIEKYPNVKVLCSQKALAMIEQFFDIEDISRFQTVKEKETLETKNHKLTFYMAPMVHWPEVMVTYDEKSKILFSADAFGSFGALNGNIIDSEVDFDVEYINEYRRYYTNIVGKYGFQVQMLLKKASNLDIQMICPLHGLILKDNISKMVEKYSKWANYEPENNGIIIVYSSVYGNTENAVNILAKKLALKGVKNIKMFDTSITHFSYILAQVFKNSHVIIATTTYNNEIFVTMDQFINVLISHNLKNRNFAIIQNGSWMPTCANIIKEKLSKLQNCKILNDEAFSIKSSLKSNQLEQLNLLVDTIVKSMK